MEWYAQPYIDFYWGHWWDEYNQFYGFRIGKVNVGVMIWRARESPIKMDSSQIKSLEEAYRYKT